MGWLGVLGLARSAYRAPARTDSLPHPSVLIGVLAFAVISVAHLFLIVDPRAARYLIPLVPALTWLSTFGGFGRTLHPDKTRLLPFRRPPAGQTGSKGSATFDFLGFTFYWARSRKGRWGVFCKTRSASPRRAGLTA